jgi:hypothetical protein
MSQGKLFSLKFRIEYIMITSFSTVCPTATACSLPDNSGKELSCFRHENTYYISRRTSIQPFRDHTMHYERHQEMPSTAQHL